MKGFFYDEEKKTSKRKTSKQKDGDPCQICGLCNQESLQHPKLEPYGKGEKKALIWGEAPGEEEDEWGEPFCGRVGRFFRPYFGRYGINFEIDCITVNTLDCRPPYNRKPSVKEIKCCYPRKRKVLEEFKPEVIFLLGEPAIKSFYGEAEKKSFSGLPLASYRGKIIPDQDLQAWICHSYHPSYIVRGNEHLEHIFDLDFHAFAYMVGKPRPSSFEMGEINLLYDEEYEVKPFLQGILDRGDEFSFDYETSSYRYYEDIHEMYVIGVTTKDWTCVFQYSDAIREPWMKLMKSDIPKIAQNIKHEVKATKYLIGCDVKNMVYCTMIGAHVLDGSQKVTGLKAQAYSSFGYPDYGLPESIIKPKQPKEKNKLSEVPFEKKGVYCGKDSSFAFRLAKKQRRLLENQGLERAYQLFHDGSLAFADVEQNGIRIDVPLAKEMDAGWGERIGILKEKVLNSKEAQLFKEETGRDLKYKKKLSDKDLRQLLFSILKFRPLKETKTTYSVDEESLKMYADDCELIEHELHLRKLTKLKETYLAQFLRYEVDGFVYPNINLHIPRSYRSSTDGPSIHNIVKHSEGVQIRKIIIPRDGREIWEPDYKSMEIRILACQSKDPVLLDYVISGGDIHGDEAEKLFMVKSSELSKDDFDKLRQSTKNNAVFPEVYGSYYRNVARNLKVPEDFYSSLSWNERYEKWETHVQEWEEEFWEKFKGVREWQDRKAEEYRRKGYIEDGAWGFRRHGYLVRNKLYNFPIQGPAFHCLLWSIIELWKKGLGFGKVWESLLCGQIHDAMFFDGVPSEFDRIKEKVDKVMTDDIREAHPWIIVPLEVEWKRGKNWLEMEDI